MGNKITNKKEENVKLSTSNLTISSFQQEASNLSVLVKTHSFEITRNSFENCSSKVDLEVRKRVLRLIDEERCDSLPSPVEIQIFLKGNPLPASSLVRELQSIGNHRGPQSPSTKPLLPRATAGLDYISLSSFSSSSLHSLVESPLSRFPKTSPAMSCSVLSPLPLDQLKNEYQTLGEGFNTQDLILEQKYRPIHEVYENLQRIGAGGFGEVFRVRHKETGEIRAMKKISKKLFKDDIDPGLEYRVLKKIDHPDIMRLIEYWESQTHIFLITEYMSGGSLRDYLKKLKILPEKKVVLIIEKILKAISYCHSQNIVHRDLKLENIMLELEDPSAIKIIDFGCSLIKSRGNDRRIAGTAYFIPPEMENGIFNEKADTWAIGIIMYALLSGRFPFEKMTTSEFYKYIKLEQIQMSGHPWDIISIQAKRMLRGLMEYSHQRRLSAKHALRSSWIMSNQLGIDVFDAHGSALKALDNLYCFKQASLVQQLILTYMSTHFRKNYQEKQIRKNFEFLDIDKNNYLTKKNLEINFQTLKKVPIDAIKILVDDIFKKVDFNKNGIIEYSEFMLANLDWENILTKANLKIVFDRFDIDKRGFLICKDFKEIFSASEDLQHQSLEMLFEEGFGGLEDVNLEDFIERMTALLSEYSPPAPTTAKASARRVSCFSTLIGTMSVPIPQ